MRGLRSEGTLLAGALWGVMALAGLTFAFVEVTARERRSEALLLRADAAAALAEGAIEVAIADLLAEVPRLPRDGRETVIETGNETIGIRIESQDGLVDLNAAPRLLLVRLIAEAARETGAALSAEEAAIAIVERRAAGGFTSREELRALDVLSRQEAEALKKFVTVHAMSAKIDPRTAPEPVLRAIPGMRSSLLAGILSAREAGGPLPAITGEPALWLAEREASIFRIEGIGKSGAVTQRRSRLVLVLPGGYVRRLSDG